MRRLLLLTVTVVFLALALLPVHSPPVWATSKPEAHGAELFATKGCAHCHGANGIGGGRGPDLQLVRKRMTKVQMATQIRDGGAEMPAFGDSLQPDEISDLVAYLAAKRKHIVALPAKPPLAPAPVAPTKNPDDDSQ